MFVSSASGEQACNTSASVSHMYISLLCKTSVGVMQCFLHHSMFFKGADPPDLRMSHDAALLTVSGLQESDFLPNLLPALTGLPSLCGHTLLQYTTAQTYVLTAEVRGEKLGRFADILTCIVRVKRKRQEPIKREFILVA